MLVLGNYLVAAAVVAASQPAPRLPDWRYEFPIEPLSATITKEWICAPKAPLSKLVFRVTDIGGELRNARFRTELVSIRVEGRRASDEVERRVKDAFHSLNNLGSVKVQCRHTNPILEIRGFAYDGKKHTSKNTTVELR